MGMYTEICTNVELVEDLPQDVLTVLKYLVEGGERPIALPDHPFFQCERWSMTLRSSSYYFIPFAHTALKYDDIGRSYYLCARADLKNYDGEIAAFFGWLQPYIDATEGAFIGYSRYEGDNEPTLYFKNAEGA